MLNGKGCKIVPDKGRVTIAVDNDVAGGLFEEPITAHAEVELRTVAFDETHIFPTLGHAGPEGQGINYLLTNTLREPREVLILGSQEYTLAQLGREVVFQVFHEPFPPAVAVEGGGNKPAYKWAGCRG